MPPRRPARRSPLFRRFFAALLLPVLLSLLPLGVFLHGRIRTLLEEEIELRQREELVLLQRALAAGWSAGAGDPLRVDPRADELAAGLSGRLTVIAPDGRVLGDSEVDGVELLALANHALRPEVEAALQGGEGVATRTSTSVGESFLYRARPLLGRDGSSLGVVRLAYSRAALEREVRHAGLWIVAALGLALLASSILAALLARRLASPIRQLQRSTGELARGELGRPIRLRTGDELEELAEDFNRMSRELAHQREELVAEKEQLAGVLDGMVEGVLVTDPGGRILQTNPALQQMFGLPRPPVGRTSLEALRNPGLEEVLARALARRERTGAVVRISHPVERHLQVGVAPLGGNGAGQGTVAVFHDITRLKKLEDVRRDFVANVSHEIRTPVTAIRGYAETLRDAAESAEERSRFAQIVIRHADRLTHLIDDLLALSSLESADYVLRLERVAAADLLAAVDEAFRPRAAEKGVHLALEPAPPGLALRGDRRLLEQVLGNLVDNAVKYTESGGRVTLAAAAAGPPGGGGDGGVEFTVSDTGCGIPAGDLERVFERFFRVDRARSRKLGGTGLGLAIVKHIVLLHGGEVRVRSRLGEGSVFTVALPVGGPAAAERPDAGATGKEARIELAAAP
ncbi:MAG: ATP-binding protein [Gemmatimonadota bacterium]